MIAFMIFLDSFNYQNLAGDTHKSALACGSKVLQLFFIEYFRPAGRKYSIKGIKSTAAPELDEGLPKAETAFVR
jgi:hypothetical protein